MDSGRNILGMSSHPDKLRKDEFWAIDDVSFELKRGEIIGLIGPNGAGKTTLLKMLNGIFWPDKGKITVNGRVSALIQLGAGFHPLLTGRENIYINASILGMTKEEVNEKFDDIIEFADIGDFLDTPVKFYSSGMFVRLGFAVAAHCEPDILLIDEVLAVGDIGFRTKCYNLISELIKDTAVIFVSHSIPIINRYCTRILLLDHGRSLFCGDPSESIEKYYCLFPKESGVVITEGYNKLNSFEVLNNNNDAVTRIDHGSLLKIKVDATIEPTVRYPIISIAFLSRELQVVGVCKSKPGTIENHDGCMVLTVDVAPFILNPGEYKISLIVFDEKEHKHLLWYNAAWDIKVVSSFMNYGAAGVCFDGVWSQEVK